MPSTETAPEPIRISLVESEACHFCEEARSSLDELARAYPLLIDIIDIRSAQGLALMQSHRASMSPLVLLDGEFFSHGRLPRRKLTRALDRRVHASSASVG
ncbi:MAG TPA: glutaredoxin [Actinomycetes bacterium]|nr:glutaredoxin [Actinomycetes bacterium]